MIEIPENKQDFLLLPEFEFPIDFMNYKLFFSQRTQNESKNFIQKGEETSKATIMQRRKVSLGKPIAKEFVDNYNTGIESAKKYYSDFIDRIEKLMEIAKTKDLPEQVVEVINDFNQKMGMGDFFKQLKEVDIVPIILYYSLLTEILNGIDKNGTDKSSYENIYDLIKDSGCLFLLLEDTEIKLDGEKTAEEKQAIVEKLRKRQNKNLLAYAYLLKKYSKSSVQNKISGKFNSLKLKKIDESDGGIDFKPIMISHECSMSVDEVKTLCFVSKILKYIDDESIKEYRQTYQNADFFNHLSAKRMFPSDVIRLKNLGIISEEKVKSTFEKCLQKKIYSNDRIDENRINQAVVEINLGHGGKPKRKKTFDLDYSQYQELFKIKAFNEDQFTAAIKKGWIDKKSILQLVANSYISRNKTLEAMNNSTQDFFGSDFEYQLLAYCVDLRTKDEIEQYIKEADEIPIPSAETIEQMVEYMHGDYNKLSTLFTSTILDYTTTVELIEKSMERGYLGEDSRNKLFDVMRRYRVEQLQNLKNAVKPEPGDIIRPRDNTPRPGLILDPLLRLEVLASMNEPEYHEIGNLKRIIIDGSKLVEKNGKKVLVPTSLDGYEVVPLPEAGVAVLEKFYKTCRVKEKLADGTISYRIEYQRDQHGRLIPETKNNATYIVPLEKGIDFSKKYNKQDLINSKDCVRVSHGMNWDFGIQAGILKVMMRQFEGNLPGFIEENVRKAKEKLQHTVDNYHNQIENNYLYNLQFR